MYTTLLLAFVLVFPALGAPLKQIQAFNCDIDDNILITPAQIMLWDSANKREVGVSTGDWALVKNQLGKGKWKDFSTRSDSFRDFNDSSSDGIYLFRKQIEKALASRGNWKGPSWKAFVTALSRPETRKHTTLITARQHSPEAILLGLKLLKKRGLIPALPDLENIYPVGWSELPDIFKGATTAESKANVMLHLLDQVEATEVPLDATLVENAAGTGKEKLHLWGFSDDDFDNYTKAIEVLSKEVAKGRWPRVKVVIFFTGLNNPTEKPHSVVIKPDGKTRATLSTEGTRMGAPAGP